MKRNGALLKNFLFRLFLLAILWWGLSEGRLPNVLVAFIIISMVAWSSLYCIRPGTWSIHWPGLLGFIGFFLIETFLAGLDVAYRAFHPKLPLAPGIISYTLQLPKPSSKIFFVWIVSLLPGTASVSLQENRVLIHVLDTRQSNHKKLEAIENRVARLLQNKLQNS
ncbi:MAG: Na+/H+ antiporter subunit E [Desulforhopalus sp.]